MPTYASVDEYLRAQSEVSRALLARVRAVIRRAAPRATESISYGIPAYHLDGKPLLYFAGWKKHYSLYPVTREQLDALGETHEVEKGTIRFPLDEPVPEKLIARIAKLRASELRAEARVKSLAKKPAKKPAKRPANKAAKRR